jgi:SAM-dependent MidA family methyltransferase
MDKLAEIIASEIADRGTIRFARFMELALYCPVYGYYEKEGDIIGRGGDYFTNVSVGPLFGELLARQFAGWAEAAGGAKTKVQPIEAGAHGGAMARDVLGWLGKERPALDEQVEYWIIEPSRARMERQRQTLQEFHRHLKWVESWPELPRADSKEKIFRIIFSNELLDAMPVHRLGWDGAQKRWFEWGVAIEQDRFVWRRLPLEAQVEESETATARVGAVGRVSSGVEHRAVVRSLNELLELMASPGDPRSLNDLLAVLPDDFTIEVSPRAEEWWQQAAQTLGRGKLLTFDYGLPVEEVFRPERTRGTLRAYRNHRVSDSILENPGQQDLTAHVNFSMLTRIGERCGLRTEEFTNQGRFLTSLVARHCGNEIERNVWTPERRRQLQTLTHPEHLGSAFKVLVQSRSA